MAAKSQSIPKWKMRDVVKSYSGKNDTTYVVNFWATFCKPCIEEIPDFLRIVEKYKSKKVKLLLVSLDLPAFYPAKIASFAKKNNYNTHIAWLNETDADVFCPMVDAKWSGAIPATIIVNNKTGYKKFTEDQISAADFEKYLNEAISGSDMNKFIAPMNDAVAIYDNPEDTAHVKREYVTFKSNDSSVYSIAGGKVSTVVKIDHMKVVIIEKDQLFYTYSNMGSTLIKKGDEVKPNQLIGYAAFDLDKYKPTVELYISTGEEYMVLTKDNFIARKDKRLSDHSIDSNDPQ
ncbi:MAG: redoxin domain-containing protein [Chitinophagaceae bacterium]|nr:redoxin domain-containing protein [Chitinophagaceae bacterium]